MPYEPYFKNLLSEERLLREHRCTGWPDERELALRVFKLESELEMLARELGLTVAEDVRGRLSLVRLEQPGGQERASADARKTGAAAMDDRLF